MTTAARKALKSLELAHDMLKEQPDPERFNVVYLSCLVLCRSIGHVLQKVDAVESKRHRSAIESAYRRWKSSDHDQRIFKNFIEENRNELIKESNFKYEIISSFPYALAVLNEELLGYDYPVDAIGICINWWHVQLREIEEEVNS
jgi:hypothetical protein